MTFLALWYLVHSITSGPPNQSWGIQVDQIFSTNHVGAYELALRRDGASQLVCASSRYSPSKGGSNLLGPTKFWNLCLRITYLGQLKNEATPWFTLCGNIRVVFCSFYSFFVFLSQNEIEQWKIKITIFVVHMRHNHGNQRYELQKEPDLGSITKATYTRKYFEVVFLCKCCRCQQ